MLETDRDVEDRAAMRENRDAEDVDDIAAHARVNESPNSAARHWRDVEIQSSDTGSGRAGAGVSAARGHEVERGVIARDERRQRQRSWHVDRGAERLRSGPRIAVPSPRR